MRLNVAKVLYMFRYYFATIPRPVVEINVVFYCDFTKTFVNGSAGIRHNAKRSRKKALIA